MGKRKVRVKRRRLKKKNIFLLFLFILMVTAAGAAGYSYMQYKSALKASKEEVEDLPVSNIEFNGVKDEKGNVNVLLLGVDSRGEEHSRSDTIMIAQYNKRTKTPKIVSIMRDSYVNIPGYGMNKINTAEALGGPDLLRETIKENFGIDLQYYVQIDFQGFTQMVDRAFPEGIEVDVKQEMSHGIGLTLSPGKQTLHGKELLGYVRFRHDAESDFGRVKRQQEVLNILSEKMVSLSGLTHVPEMTGAVQPFIETNVEKKTMLSVATSAMKEGSNLESLRVPVDDSFENARVMIGNDEAAVLEVDLEKNKEALREFLR